MIEKQEKIYSGVVENGKFDIRQREPLNCYQVDLTTIHVQTAQTPESAQIDLSKYEGKNIEVSGRLNGCWIFDAEIIDE